MTFLASVRPSQPSQDVIVIDLAGRMAFGESMALQNLIGDLMSKGHRKFVLNLCELNHLDSSGIGELVRSYTSVKTRGGTVKMVCLKPRIEEILALARLTAVLEDYADEQSALRSFQP